MGCFQDDTAVGKIQHGPAWWFSDHELGMRDHLTTLSSISLVSNFVGMLIQEAFYPILDMNTLDVSYAIYLDPCGYRKIPPTT